MLPPGVVMWRRFLYRGFVGRRATRPIPATVLESVDRDPVEPGAQRFRIPQFLDLTAGSQQNVLIEVGAVVTATGQFVAEGFEFAMPRF